jgi:hypothetical protein
MSVMLHPCCLKFRETLGGSTGLIQAQFAPTARILRGTVFVVPAGKNPYRFDGLKI